MDYVDCKWTIFWLKLAWIYFGFLQKNVRIMEKKLHFMNNFKSL